MSTSTPRPFKREILDGDKNAQVCSLLQSNLANLVDLSLLLKQAHWNVVGMNFQSVHLQLDEIVETIRDASDEVAERLATLGTAAEGRAATVSRDSVLSHYPDGFVSVENTISGVCDALKTTIDQLRDAIDQTGDLDPITEDLLISISGPIEKHLWMMQAQES